MSDTNAEIAALLTEIRNLLIPVADAYRDDYEVREAKREADRVSAIRDLVAGSTKREAAWRLADGTRTQREIAREAGLDEGSTSKFFKALRDLGAVSESKSPERLVEV